MARRRSDLLLAAGILGVLVISLTASVQGGTVAVGGKVMGGSCWMNEWLGVLCPFCGMTRSFIALGSGDLMSSLAFHPGGFLMFSMAMLLLGWIAIAGVRRAQPVCSQKLFLPLVQTVSLVCVGIGIVRTLVS